jgi:hypothetical protein
MADLLVVGKIFSAFLQMIVLPRLIDGHRTAKNRAQRAAGTATYILKEN